MIYTDLTKKAMTIAYNAHHGQVDKAGMPYIFHPYHLAEQMQDEVSVCVALLHDVVEDTDVTFDALAELFPADIMEALRLLTHADGEPYFDYVRRIKDNEIAKAVKLADIAHNADQTRLGGCQTISEEKRLRLKQKYEKAKAILEEPYENEARK